MKKMKLRIDDEVEIKRRKADNRGRVALGSEYSDRRVTVLILSSSEAKEEQLKENEGGEKA